jgi:hypothetical protein
MLYVARSQLVQLTLAADGLGAADTAVTLTLFDGQGQEVLRLTAGAGQTITGPDLFLAPGVYTASLVLQVSAEGLSAPLFYHLWGAGLTDPIGPALEDATLLPLTTTSTEPTLYHYPGDALSASELVWVSVVLLLLS